MGPGLGPACGPCFLEGPKPKVGLSLTFGEGPENLSILISTFEGPSKAQA